MNAKDNEVVYLIFPERDAGGLDAYPSVTVESRGSGQVQATGPLGVFREALDIDGYDWFEITTVSCQHRGFARGHPRGSIRTEE